MLRGSSESIRFIELLQVLSDLHQTGRLEVRAERTSATFLIDEGRVTSMIGRGGGAPFSVTTQECTEPWSEPALDLIAGMINARHMMFSFDPGPAATKSQVCPSIETAVLIREAGARAARWAQIQELIPDWRAQPVLAPEPGEIGSLETAEWQLLARIGEAHTVAGLFRSVEGSRLDSFEVLARLIERGLVLVESQAAPAAVAVDQDRVELPDPVESVTVISPNGSPTPWPTARSA